MRSVGRHPLGGVEQADELLSGGLDIRLRWKVIEPDYIKLYNDANTEPEIDSFLAYYKLPAGKTMLSKSPELSSKTLTIPQQHMASIEPQLHQMVTDFIKQTTPAASTAPTLKSLPPSTSTPPSPATPPKP